MPRKMRFGNSGAGANTRSPSAHHDGDVYCEHDRPLYSPRPDSAASTSSMDFVHKIGGVPTPFQEASAGPNFNNSPASSVRSWTAASGNGGNTGSFTAVRRRSSGDRRPVSSSEAVCSHNFPYPASTMDAVELYYNRHEMAQQIQSYNDYLANYRYSPHHRGSQVLMNWTWPFMNTRVVLAYSPTLEIYWSSNGTLLWVFPSLDILHLTISNVSSLFQSSGFHSPTMAGGRSASISSTSNLAPIQPSTPEIVHISFQKGDGGIGLSIIQAQVSDFIMALGLVWVGTLGWLRDRPNMTCMQQDRMNRMAE